MNARRCSVRLFNRTTSRHQFFLLIPVKLNCQPTVRAAANEIFMNFMQGRKGKIRQMKMKNVREIFDLFWFSSFLRGSVWVGSGRCSPEDERCFYLWIIFLLSLRAPGVCSRFYSISVICEYAKLSTLSALERVREKRNQQINWWEVQTALNWPSLSLLFLELDAHRKQTDEISFSFSFRFAEREESSRSGSLR